MKLLVLATILGSKCTTKKWLAAPHNHVYICRINLFGYEFFANHDIAIEIREIYIEEPNTVVDHVV